MQPIPSTNELLHYKDFRHFSDTFIETGSGHGDGIQRALDAGFARIFSIEAYYDSFLLCARRFVSNGRVRLYRGKSVEVLPKLLRMDLGQCVFFLDAHPSNEKSYGYNEVALGEQEYTQDKIIRDELGLILGDERRHILMIDDLRGDSDDCAHQYVEIVQRAKPGYSFAFYDENLSGDNPEFFYKDKLLVAVPYDY